MFASFSRFAPQLLGLLRIVAGLLFLSHGLVKIVGFPAVPPGRQELLTLFGIGGVIELVAGTLIMIVRLVICDSAVAAWPAPMLATSLSASSCSSFSARTSSMRSPRRVRRRRE